MLISEDFLRAEVAYRAHTYAGERRETRKKKWPSSGWTFLRPSVAR